MKQRIFFLLRVYLLTVILFVGYKTVFLVLNRTAHPFTVADMADVLRHGLTLDLSTGLYFLVVPFLITVVSIRYTGRGLRWAQRVWFGFTAVALTLAFAADAALYPHWGYKLDASCLQYLSSPAAAAASVKTWQLVTGLAGLIVLTGLIGWLYMRQTTDFRPLRSRRGYSLLCVLLLPLMFIGIRGGVDKSTTNIGQVYYSQTPFLNHAAVNPLFSFFASMGSSSNAEVHYDFFTQEECDRLLTGVYDTRTVSPDTLLTTQRPNVIVVMLESTGGQFTKIGGRDYIMPYFNRLTDEGVYFSECYANSFRTDRATVCIFGGHQSFPTVSLQKIPTKNAALPGLARSLRRVGYDTRYYYGGDINFTKKRSYLINAGFDRFVSKSDFSRSERRTAQWGVCDSIVFDRILQEVKTWRKEDKTPHLIGYNTLSSHEPWDVPVRELDDPVENAFRYLDNCIKRFISELRQMPQWENLLVVFIPDHGVAYYGLDETTPLKMHIPVLWVGGAVREPRVVGVVCNQSDQAATLLGQLGICHDDYRFSRDVLSQTYTRPFAYHSFNNGFSVVDSTRFVVYDLTSGRVIAGEDTPPSLVERGKAILQVSGEDLNLR
ncbi:MAG: sulfatase-like hydrolase/transferase [Bacteroidaceae bacterium]|nr:sulfatase-like hydrolase/transferase [Bacteroidaceae bacterium]